MMGLLRSDHDGRSSKDLQNITLEDYEGDDVAGFSCMYNESNENNDDFPSYVKINGCGYDGGFRVIPANQE